MTGTCDASIADDAVFGLVKRRCWACHASNGLAGHDFTSVAALRTAPIIDMVGSCQMPPDGSPLADADRRHLVDWASCVTTGYKPSAWLPQAAIVPPPVP